MIEVILLSLDMKSFPAKRKTLQILAASFFYMVQGDYFGFLWSGNGNALFTHDFQYLRFQVV